MFIIGLPLILDLDRLEHPPEQSSRSQLSALGGGRDRPLLHETMAPMSLLLLLLLLLLGLGGGAAHCPDDPWCPSTANCTVNWYNQTIDHFNWGSPAFNPPQYTFKQRYFSYDKYHKPGGPIFFYFGNEDYVDLYVNHTGLMWENAAEFGAMLIFAEHRFYGESKPFPEGTDKCLDWLTTEQAMADFAQLIDHFRTTDDRFTKSAVVGFGGSYGGMIGAWFRVKYPNAADGVIAASAPIWSFTGLDPPYNYQAFSEGVTHDLSAGAGAGASDNCKKNLHAAYPLMQSTGRTKEGRAMLSSAFKTCYAIETEEEVAALISWAQGPFANMAMGNYPYPSTYLMHGDSFLPAWPMRKACEALDADGLTGKPEELFEAVREALAVQLNNTGTATCFYNGDEREMRATLKDGETMADVYGERVRMAGKKMTDAHRMVRRWERREGRKRGLRGERQMAADGSCAGDWDMQWCTEMSQPFSYGCPDPDPIFPEDGAPADFHWPCEPFNKTVRTESCLENWGFQPRYDWARFGLGGKRISGASNIVFSNGLYDPWHGGGILKNLSDTLIAVVLPHGAHHLDLMFSNPADPPDAVDARKTEVQEMKRWVKDANQRNGNTLYQIAL